MKEKSVVTPGNRVPEASEFLKREETRNAGG